MGWFSEQIKKRKENNQVLFENSINDLAGIKNIVSGDEKDLRGNFICSQLIKYFGINNADIPYHISGTYEKIDYLFKSYDVIGRKIELTRGWNVENRDPILVFSKRTRTPLIFLPSGSRNYYYISYDTGKRKNVPYSLIQYFEKEAYTFYKPLPSHKLTFKEYFKYFRKSIRVIDLISVILFAVLATLIGMLLPYVMKRLTGEVVTNKDYHLYMVVTSHIIGVGVSYILIKAAQAFINARVAIKIEKMMMETTMKRMLSLPPSFFKKYSTGELSTRFNSVSMLSSLIFNGIFLVLLSSVMSLAFMTQIVQFTPSLVLPVIIILLLNTIVTGVVSFVEVKHFRKLMGMTTKESSMSYSLISGIQKIRLAGAEKRAFAKWAKAYSRSSFLMYNPPLIVKLSAVITLLITLTGNLLIYYLAARNNVDVSSFVAFTTSFASLSLAFSSLARIGAQIARIKPVLEMTKPIIEEEQEDNNKEKIEKLDGNIRLENVSFKYEDDGKVVIDNLNLNIKQGEFIGIVGKTGCGKSTIVRMLLGFEKPTSGHIYYDDKDIDNINLQSLRKNIGSVLQNGGIFHADILSNILITAPDLGEDEAWEAARVAGISEDIKNMPMGMRTVISEGQGGISGGQKQRIMIARAIINKPRILIFDEATSALDNKTQKSISDSISGLNCTRIVIAHRLSTIKNCDRIIYMEDGKILEEGTYEDLTNKKGKFFELIERQRIE